MTVTFYPVSNLITGITNELNALITTATDHGYTLGQVVTLFVSGLFGMSQINGLNGIITAIPSTNSFNVNIDSTNFNVFSVPVTTPITPPQVVPVGMAAVAPYGNSLDDATINITP